MGGFNIFAVLLEWCMRVYVVILILVMNLDENVLPNSTPTNYLDYEVPQSFSEFSLEEDNVEEDSGEMGPKQRQIVDSIMKLVCQII